jgi:rhodanese-related sulfurtransferase
MSPKQRRLDELLAEAAGLIERLTPAEAAAAASSGALVVDIRSELARERTGVIPGSIHVPRTVLEWRFEPGGAWRSPSAGGLDEPLVVICEHGFSSVFAAAALARLGYARVGDVVGGFEAWQHAGLPVVPAPPPHAAHELPGMDGPA